MHTKKEAALVFVLGLLLFCTVDFHGEFIQFNSRFGLFAQEMWHTGVNFYPTVYGKFYPDYFATQTILMYFVSRIFGGISLSSAVLPTAIAAAFTLSITYLIGAIHCRKLGIYAVLFEISTLFFFSAARTPSLDHFTSTITVFCFYIVYSSDMYNAPKRLSWLPLALLTGFAFRGPIGFVIPASVVWIYYVLLKDFKRLLFFSIYSSIMLVLCSCLLFWTAYWQGGMEFLNQVLDTQASGRLVNARSNPWYYYLVRGLGAYAISFPIFLIVVISYGKQLWARNPDKHIQLLKLLVGWIFIILIGLSIPATKKTRYILSIAPATSLVAAYLFWDIHKSKLIYYTQLVLLQACKLLPFLGAIGIWIALLVIQHSYIQELLSNEQISLSPAIKSWLPLSFFFLLQGMALFTLLTKIKDGKIQKFAIFTTGVSFYVLLQIILIEPLILSIDTAKSFVQRVESSRNKKEHLVFYGIGPDGDDVKYVVNMNSNHIVSPLFIRTLQDLEKCEYSDPDC